MLGFEGKRIFCRIFFVHVGKGRMDNKLYIIRPQNINIYTYLVIDAKLKLKGLCACYIRTVLRKYNIKWLKMNL